MPAPKGSEDFRIKKFCWHFTPGYVSVDWPGPQTWEGGKDGLITFVWLSLLVRLSFYSAVRDHCLPIMSATVMLTCVTAVITWLILLNGFRKTWNIRLMTSQGSWQECQWILSHFQWQCTRDRKRPSSTSQLQTPNKLVCQNAPTGRFVHSYVRNFGRNICNKLTNICSTKTPLMMGDIN